MRNRIVISLSVALGASIAGCGPRKEVVVTGTDNQNTTNQEPRNGDRPERGGPPEPGPLTGHGGRHHGHAFTDPVERAKTWNDPERDAWQRPAEIVAALALKPGATVADVGAGTGYMVAHLSRAVGEDGTVVAIDASADMVAYLTKRTADLGPARVAPRKVGPSDPELQPATVDAVLALDTWHHVSEREAYAKRVYAGLKRGGRFVVVDHEVGAEVGPPKVMRLEPSRVAEQLEAAGFRTEVVPESMPRHYMVVGHKD